MFIQVFILQQQKLASSNIKIAISFCHKKNLKYKDKRQVQNQAKKKKKTLKRTKVFLKSNKKREKEL